MFKKLTYIITIILSMSLYVFANTTFEIDEAFFIDTGIGSGDYSPIHFGFNDNSADSIAFWGNSVDTTGMIIFSGETIECNKQIEGLYINTLRGNKVWPLDQNTLNDLSFSANLSGYYSSIITMTGGFFTECNGTGVNTDEIYGYIEHYYNGNTYKLWAGIDYDLSAGTTINSFSGTLKLITGTNITAEGYLFDNYGGIATVYSNQELNTNFSWTGNNRINSGGTYYTRYTGLQATLWSNQTGKFELSGDLVNILTGNIIGGNSIDQNIEIANMTGSKEIAFNVSNSSGSLTSLSYITYDNEAPILSFIDGVDPNVNPNDIVSVDFGDATVKKYKIISASGNCNENIIGLNDYTGSITIDTNIYNGEYFCAYAEDFLGNISTLVSNDVFNINTTSPTISFIDTVEIGPVQSDTVTITGSNITGGIRYKFIDNISNCNNTNGTSYTIGIFLVDETNNGKYICVYASGEVSGVYATGISNQINIDITDPIFAGVTSGTTYSGNVAITFSDINLSGATLNGVAYTSGTAIASDNNYIFIVSDLAGNSTGATFTIDQTSPVISWIDIVELGPVASDTVSVDFGDATIKKYKLVNNTGDCNNTNLINYTGAITYNNTSVNDKYFCAYGEDTVGNRAILYSDNTFNINTTSPTISFTDNVEIGPVQSDTVIITGSNITGGIRYKFIDNISNCNNTNGTSYTGSIILNDESHNGNYICAYASGEVSGYITGMSNQINIDITDPVLTENTAIIALDNDSTPEYIFSSTETGTITYGGSCGSITSNAIVGLNTIILNNLSDGEYSNCTIKVTDTAGNQSNTLTITTFEIDTTNPIVNGVVNGGSYTGSTTITFSDVNLSGATIDGNTISNGVVYSTTGSHILIVSDLAGNSVIINFTITENIIPDTTAPSVSLISPSNGSTTTGTSNTFSWTGSDNIGIASYSLYISGTTMYTNIGATSPVTTTLASGNYTWYVVATDTSGNTGQSVSRTFVMADATTPDTTDPVVELIYPTSGLVINSNSITLQWSGSDNVAIDYYDIYVDGDTDYTLLNVISNSGTVSNIVNGSYSWHVIATDVNGNTGQSNTLTFVISGNINTAPTLISPTSGSNIYIGNLELTWSGYSNSGYQWQIANNTGFSNIVSSGDSQNLTSVVLNNPDFMTGLFYWRVVNTQTTSISDYRSINILDLTGGVDIQVDDFDFDNENDANLSTIYESNQISITGISNNVYVQASLEDNIGALFINDIMVGSSGWVKNGDEVYIELISSNDYDERVSAKLMVGTGENMVSDIFRVDTKSAREIELSYAQKIQAMLLLDTLIDIYGDNTEKLAQFLITFKSVLKDKSDWLENEIDDLNNGDDELEIFVSQKAGVDYMYDIVDEYLNDMDYEGHNVYIAPNGKEYIVEYRNDKLAYTSPNFMYDKYFPTRKDFTKHIDINNTGPYYGDKGGEKVMAPNEKIYYIVQQNGKWTSTTFKYSKYFDTREQLIDYIFANNPGETWDHKVDTDFDEIEYTAPNGKKYTIFKTSDKGNNPNMYSSYKFVTPKYFPTVQRVKDHILSQNK